jgi:hypothetical protein
MEILVTAANGGASVKFKYDAAVLASFKERFPTAKFNSYDKSWFVKGVTAEARARTWAEETKQAVNDAAHREKAAAQLAADRMKQDIDTNGLPDIPGFGYVHGHAYASFPSSGNERGEDAAICYALGLKQSAGRWLVPLEMMATLRDRAGEVRAAITVASEEEKIRKKETIKRVEAASSCALFSTGIGGFRVRTPYREDIVALLRSIQGAAWNKMLLEWQVPLSSAESLLTVLPRINDAIAEMQREKQARQRDAVARAEVGQKRMPFLVESCPRKGVVFEKRGSILFATDVGPYFTIDDDAPSLYGSEFLGHEGERGVWVTYRAATEEEAALFTQNKEAEAARRKEIKHCHKRLQEISEQIKTQGRVLPQNEVSLNGRESLVEFNKKLFLYGGGSEIFVTNDFLCFMMHNGADGDDWSRNNFPGSIIWFAPRSPELEQEIRQLSALLAEPTLQRALPPAAPPPSPSERPEADPPPPGLSC